MKNTDIRYRIKYLLRVLAARVAKIGAVRELVLRDHYVAVLVNGKYIFFSSVAEMKWRQALNGVYKHEGLEVVIMDDVEVVK